MPEGPPNKQDVDTDVPPYSNTESSPSPLPPPSRPPPPQSPSTFTLRDRCTPYGPDRHSQPPPPPPPSTPPTRHHLRSPPPTPHQSRNGKYDKNGEGINVRGSLGIMGLEEGVTVWEVTMRYRLLSRKIHPNRNGTEVMVMMAAEAVQLFKLFNNVQEHLSEIIWS